MDRPTEEQIKAYLQNAEKLYGANKNGQWWYEKNETVESIRTVANRCKSIQSENQVFSFKLRKSFAFIFILILFNLLPYLNPKTKISFEPSILWIIFNFLALASSLHGIVDRRVKLKVDQEGIHYKNCRKKIAWDSIVAIYVATVILADSESRPSHALLVHYYDKEKQLFTSQRITVDGFDKDYEDICGAIQYMHLFRAGRTVTIPHEFVANSLAT